MSCSGKGGREGGRERGGGRKGGWGESHRGCAGALP